MEILPLKFDDMQLDVVVNDKWKERLIPVGDVASALGYNSDRALRRLIDLLVTRGEMREPAHYMKLKIPTRGGDQLSMCLTYRGIIRVVMRSNAPRAAEFRDFVENVAYLVLVKGYRPDYLEEGGYGVNNHRLMAQWDKAFKFFQDCDEKMKAGEAKRELMEKVRELKQEFVDEVKVQLSKGKLDRDYFKNKRKLKAEKEARREALWAESYANDDWYERKRIEREEREAREQEEWMRIDVEEYKRNPVDTTGEGVPVVSRECHDC